MDGLPEVLGGSLLNEAGHNETHREHRRVWENIEGYERTLWTMKEHRRAGCSRFANYIILYFFIWLDYKAFSHFSSVGKTIELSVFGIHSLWNPCLLPIYFTLSHILFKLRTVVVYNRIQRDPDYSMLPIGRLYPPNFRVLFCFNLQMFE